MMRDTPRHTVAPRSRWRLRWPAYVLIVVATGLAAYGWGLATAGRAEPTCSFTSTARVLWPAAAADAEQAEFAASMRPDPETVERQVGSQASLRRAVRQWRSAARPSVAEGSRSDPDDRDVGQLQQRLRVSAAAVDEWGDLDVSITYTDRDPQFAAGLVNTLAETYASERRTEWRAAAQQRYLEAKRAADRAEAEWVAATSELDEFLRRHFTRQAPPQSQDPLVEPPQPELRAEAPAGTSESKQTDEPDRTALTRELAERRRRLQELLITRTPVHPEVQEAEDQIAQVEEKLAALTGDEQEPPSELPEAELPGSELPGPELPEPDGLALPVETPRSQPGLSEIAGGETVRQFRQLQAVVARAAEARDQAVRTAAETWKYQAIEPQIDVLLARAIEAPGSELPGRGLVWLAVVVGVVMATGTGLVSAGASIEPTLDTCDQVEAAIRVPIVGSLSATDSTHRLAAQRSRKFLVRRILIGGGLILMAACVGASTALLGRF
ncbi:MAG: hypothetical protein JXB62_18335 [Pirellulales bacterium]|nr:hypothetical protein [Pirellulales bacterium]